MTTDEQRVLHARGFKRDKVVKISRLKGCENFVGEIERSLHCMRSLTLSQWRDLRMGVKCVDLGALTTASKTVLNLLEPVKLTVCKVIENCSIASSEWTIEVAMVLDVLKSRYGRIQRSSRM